MPSRQDGPPKTFTWINGNPRSKQNISQIRRHAGQSSAAKAGYLGGSPSANLSAPSGAPELANATQPQPSNGDSQHWPTSAEGVKTQVHVPLTDAVSTPQSACANQVRRLTINELINAADDEDDNSDFKPPAARSSTRSGHNSGGIQQQNEGALSKATPGYPLTKDKLDIGQHRSSRGGTKSSSPLSASKGIFRANANVFKRSKYTLATSSRASWRYGSSRGSLIPLSRDEFHIARLLQKTSEFYVSSFETTWSPLLRHNSSAFDSIGTIEIFSGSVAAAASLISINRIEPATSILNCIVSNLRSLLTTQHPQLYYVLAELSLDTSDTDIGRLRAQLKTLASNIANSSLGEHHPVAELLRLRLTPAVSTRLRELVQRQVRSLYTTFFTSTSYQAIGQSYFLARLLSQLNQPDEAMEILAWFIRTSEMTYGSQSLMPVTGLLELAKVHLVQARLTDTETSTVPDSTLRAEELASDALRRTLALDPGGAVRPLSTSIAHSRIGCLRTLGRIHLMRQNFATATHYYTEAVRVGVEQLGPDVAAVQLALADLDGASELAVQAERHVGPIAMSTLDREALLRDLSSINVTAVI